MIKHILPGAVALMMIAGPVLAQDTQTSTQQRTVIDRPNGDQTVNTQHTVRTNDGVDQHTVSRDVSRTTDPYGDQSVTSKTTTTNRDDDAARTSTTTTVTHQQ